MLMVDESGGMTADNRIFRIDSDGADELVAKPFDDEKQMQYLIERRIGKLFPGLELLGSEYRNLDDGKHRLDTIAFHKEKNTFVVIEYKNTRNTGVIAQAKSYLKYVREKRAELILSYGKKTGLYPDPNQFEWNAAYAIIVAPEFSANHIDSTANDTDVELYRIERYGDDIIVLRRAGGAHKNVSASGHSNQDDCPDPRTDPVAAEKYYLDKQGTSDATRTVWHELKKRVKDELGIKFSISKAGGAFYLQNRLVGTQLE